MVDTKYEKYILDATAGTEKRSLPDVVARTDDEIMPLTRIAQWN